MIRDEALWVGVGLTPPSPLSSPGPLLRGRGDRGCPVHPPDNKFRWARCMYSEKPPSGASSRTQEN